MHFLIFQFICYNVAELYQQRIFADLKFNIMILTSVSESQEQNHLKMKDEPSLRLKRCGENEAIHVRV